MFLSDFPPRLLPRLFFTLIFLACLVAGTRGMRASPTVPANPLQTLVAGHPRLLIDEAGFTDLRARLETDKILAEWFSGAKSYADAALSQAPVIGPKKQGLLDQARVVKSRIYALAMAYRMTGEKPYLDRAWAELNAAMGLPSWSDQSFLATAEMTHAFAIAYDWLYRDWTPEQRNAIASAIIQKGIKPALPYYTSKPPRKPEWATSTHNWNPVCNGGIGVGALAIAEVDKALAGDLLRKAIGSLPLAMNQFGPDGAWGEGPTYWQYAIEYNVLFLAAMQTALGTDFGLSSIPGFSFTASFPLAFTGLGGRAFSYGDAGEIHSEMPELFWLAKKFNNPNAAAFQLKTAGKTPAKAASDMVWGSWWLQHPPVERPRPPGQAFRGVNVAFMRSDANSPQSAFVGFKGGDNRFNHGHLDIGTFVYDAAGCRWAVDIGGDAYSMPAYFGNKRWTYYRCRAEGHNTLVIASNQGPDQSPSAVVPLAKTSFKPGNSFATANLTPAYPNAASVRRGLRLLGNSLLIQDEIQNKSPSDVRWFLHTEAAIEPNGRTAKLTIGDQTLTATILEPATATFEALPVQPLPSSPKPPGQLVAKQLHKSLSKLGIHLPQTSSTRLVVFLTPDQDPKGAPPTIVPVMSWQ